MTLQDSGVEAATSERARSAAPAGSGRPALPEVSFATFASVDLRVGRVVAVEENAKARKPAWKIGVDFGPLGTLWTSAQVRQYPREELLGSLVVGAVNLGAKRIAGSAASSCSSEPKTATASSTSCAPTPVRRRATGSADRNAERLRRRPHHPPARRVRHGSIR